MTNRLTKKLVTFRNPFVLESHDQTWPAGDYTIETEEEPLNSRSFLAYRKIATTMVVRSRTGKRTRTQFVEIDSAELDAALARDTESIERAENEGMTAL